MPKNKQRSELFKKYGPRLEKAHELHKGDETEYSQFGELPPGINGGIAQLVDCRFGQYAKGDLTGEYFFYAAGTVHSPIEHEGVRTEGLRTSITEPLCDTPNKTRKTVEDHLGWIYNELRKLGVDTENMDVSQLEETCADLKEMQPFFRFRTWQGEATPQYPNPRVNHQWGGQVDYSPDEDAGAATEDETEEATPTPPKKAGTKATSNGKATQVAKNGAVATPTQVKGKNPKKAPTPPPEEPEEEAEAFNEFGDLMSLGKAADEEEDSQEKDDAQQKLTDMALEAGISQETIDNIENWSVLAGMISDPRAAEEQGEAEEESTTEEEPEAEEWSIGQVCLFKPLDPKTKKRAAKGVECEILMVDKDKGSVDLKNLENGKTIYKNVKWDLLTPIG